MASRTKFSGPLILALALCFGFLMTQLQYPLNIIFPFVSLGILVPIAMKLRW